MNPFETRQYWDWQAKNRGAYLNTAEKEAAREAVIHRIRTKQYKAIDVYLGLLGEEFSNDELRQVIALIRADLLFASWDTVDAREANAFLAGCEETLRISAA